MYDLTKWQDHVTELQNTYKETVNLDGTVTHEPVEGEVLQQGTPMNAAKFNNMEQGIFENNALQCWLAQMQKYDEDNKKEKEIAIITIANDTAITAGYVPFSNYEFADRNHTGYTVTPIVTQGSASVTVSNLQTNAFRYTTSEACTVVFIVQGGYIAPNGYVAP